MQIKKQALKTIGDLDWNAQKICQRNIECAQSIRRNIVQ